MCGGHEPDGSGVYRCLKTMETKGLVASSWILSDSGPPNGPISSPGRRTLPPDVDRDPGSLPRRDHRPT